MGAYGCIPAVDWEDDEAVFPLVEKLNGVAACWKISYSDYKQMNLLAGDNYTR